MAIIVALAAMMAWGTDHFHGLGIPRMQLPQTETAALGFEGRLTDAGLIVFRDFFRTVTRVTLTALLVGMVMV